MILFSKYAYAPLGAKEVRVFGFDEKRQVTGVLGASAAGHLLPWQNVFGGETPGCLAKEEDRREAEAIGCHFTFTSNH